MALEGWGMASADQEPRIAVFLDYENLAIGAKDNLGRAFDFGPVADALAEFEPARPEAAGARPAGDRRGRQAEHFQAAAPCV